MIVRLTCNPEPARQLITKLRRNMKNRLMPLTDKLLLRNRSPVNFLVNLVCGLIAYSHQPKKSSLGMDWALPAA